METKVNVIFILDRSGSMSGLENDVIGGYNAFIKKQRGQKGKAYITTVLFDHMIELLHASRDIDYIKELTCKDYYVRGTTALLDAIGYTLNKYKNTVADHHLVIINTDGYENASSEYNYQQIYALINELKKKDWEFIFMGTKIDAIKEADKLGIHQDRAVNYESSKHGIQSTFDVINDVTQSLRNNERIKQDSSWKKKIH